MIKTIDKSIHCIQIALLFGQSDPARLNEKRVFYQSKVEYPIGACTQGYCFSAYSEGEKLWRTAERRNCQPDCEVGNKLRTKSMIPDPMSVQN